MCRLFFADSNNHQFAGSSPTERRKLKQANDCIAILPDGVSGGIKGEVNYTIIELPGIDIENMQFLLEQVRAPDPGDPTRIIITDYRRKTTNLTLLRAALSAEDKKRFDKHPDFPVNAQSKRRQCPQLARAVFEIEVVDR